uniref:BED-type domain-containing protein n=1 Tax=Oryzias melastigma TaxID=30732 RepID=A0A3B3C6A5_ORYME
FLCKKKIFYPLELKLECEWKMDTRKRSDIWMHFDISSATHAKCKICKTNLSFRGGSTSNMRRHLGSKHPTVMLQQMVTSLAPTASSQQEIINTSSEPPPKKRHKVDQALVKMIAKDFQPFSIVDDQGFRQYTKALDPSYVLPSRTTISRQLMPNLFEKVRADILEKVKAAPAVCLTTDCWTSSTTTSYMSVTCHYLSDFKLQSNLLDCFELADNHTAENLARELERVATEWTITEKIVACVSDSAANIKKAVGDILHWNHLSCFAHILNLIVRNGIQQPQIQEIIKKVKAITEYTRRSTVASAKLKETQQQMGQPQLRLKQDVPTRWNSTYYMLKRITDVKDPLISTLALVNPQIQSLSLEEWEMVKETCAVLHPFEEVTVELSSERYVKTYLYICILYNVITRLCLDTFFKHFQVCSIDDDFLKTILMARGLQRVTAHHQRNPSTHHLLADATLLDPRFKKHAFLHDRYAEDAVTRVVSAASRSVRPPSLETESTEEEEGNPPQVNPPNESVIWADFEERVSSLRPGVQNPVTEAMLEIKGFLTEQLLPRTSDPLEWWKTRAIVFKKTCDVMKTRLCIVATSVPSERIFSKAGQIITDRRNRLSPGKVRELIFLNANL